MPTYGDGRSGVQRVSAVLQALATAGPEGMSAAAVARHAQLPPATAHRMLVDLEQEGVTVRRSATRSWVLSGMVLGWGEAAARQLGERASIHEMLLTIAAATGETVVLTEREHFHGTHTDLVESQTRLRFVEHIGLRLPLTEGASRRAILAFLSEAEQEQVIDRYPHPYLSQRALRQELAATRRAGFAISVGEATPYTVGIAVPLLTAQEPTASIMVGAPAHRFPANVLREVLEVLTSTIHPANRLPHIDLDSVEGMLAAANAVSKRRAH